MKTFRAKKLAEDNITIGIFILVFYFTMIFKSDFAIAFVFVAFIWLVEGVVALFISCIKIENDYVSIKSSFMLSRVDLMFNEIKSIKEQKNTVILTYKKQKDFKEKRVKL